MTETATVDTLTLNNGITMPALGLGVFQTPPDKTVEAVASALRIGAPAELQAIDALDTGIRGGPDPAVITTDTFALTIPEA